MWKDIIGWEDLYEIHPSGQIRNKLTNRILKGDYNNVGYRRVILYDKPNKKRYFVHRLVAIHFITNHEGMPEVNHKNGNKHDNCVQNLEWVSREQNGRHVRKLGLKNNNFCQKKIQVTYSDGPTIVYKSQKKFSKKTDISIGIISSWLTRGSKSYLKYNIINIKYI